jgi:hypothetical protein
MLVIVGLLLLSAAPGRCLRRVDAFLTSYYSTICAYCSLFLQPFERAKLVEPKAFQTQSQFIIFAAIFNAMIVCTSSGRLWHFSDTQFRPFDVFRPKLSAKIAPDTLL